MSGVLTLPRLGETMEEGRIVVWLVGPGSAFKRGDALLEVETDKTVVEIPALEDGALAEILAPEGSQVSVGAALARLEGTSSTEPTQSPQATPEKPASQNKVRATPLARRLAKRAGLDLHDIPGTGRRGRVERTDVERFANTREARDINANAYTLSGPNTGAAVLLLHGFGGDRSVWSGLSAGLARAGCRVLAVDLPGHGQSRQDAEQPRDLSLGLAELIEHTVAEPTHIVAHSLGAAPAVALAEAGRARSLTLIAPAGLGLRIDRTFVEGLAATQSAGEVGHLLERMTEMPLPLSQTALGDIAKTLGQGRLTKLAEALVGPAGQTLSLRAPLARLAETLPVRILAPHQDRILDWTDMLTVSPRIAVHHLPRAGHMAVWDAPQEVLQIVLDIAQP